MGINFTGIQGLLGSVILVVFLAAAVVMAVKAFKGNLNKVATIGAGILLAAIVFASAAKLLNVGGGLGSNVFTG